MGFIFKDPTAARECLLGISRMMMQRFTGHMGGGLAGYLYLPHILPHS